MPPPRPDVSPTDALSPARRLAAWLVTGPLGHLAAGVVDWAVALARYGWARARGRRPFEPS